MKRYYLEDKLIVDESQDKFGHKNLANVLYDLVINQHNADNEKRTPRNEAIKLCADLDLKFKKKKIFSPFRKNKKIK